MDALVRFAETRQELLGRVSPAGLLSFNNRRILVVRAYTCRLVYSVYLVAPSTFREDVMDRCRIHQLIKSARDNETCSTHVVLGCGLQVGA